MKKTKLVLLFAMIILLAGCQIIPVKEKSNSGSQNKSSAKSNKKSKSKNGGKTNGKSYKIGDEVTVKGEAFYVFEDSNSSEPTIVLFAKYNLTKDGAKQYVNSKYDETKVEFSATAYWYNEAKAYDNWDTMKFNVNDVNGNGAGDAITKARSYASFLGAFDGRLITYEEVEKLKDNYQDMIGGHDNKPEGEDYNYLDYYTATVRPFNLEKVYAVRGHHEPTLEVDSALYGVRPIIEISKDLID